MHFYGFEFRCEPPPKREAWIDGVSFFSLENYFMNKKCLLIRSFLSL